MLRAAGLSAERDRRAAGHDRQRRPGHPAPGRRPSCAADHAVGPERSSTLLSDRGPSAAAVSDWRRRRIRVARSVRTLQRRFVPAHVQTIDVARDRARPRVQGGRDTMWATLPFRERLSRAAVRVISAPPVCRSRSRRSGLTFDDVLLQPAESDVIPSEVATASRVSKRITRPGPAGLLADGHRDRGPDGGGDRPPGRAGHHPPQPVDRGPGAPGRRGQALRGRDDRRADHHLPGRHHRRGRRDVRPVPDLRRAGGRPAT